MQTRLLCVIWSILKLYQGMFYAKIFNKVYDWLRIKLVYVALWKICFH